MPKLSQRGHDAPASPIRKLAPYADAAKQRGITVHHLNIGQPDIDTPRGMIERYQAFDQRVVEYAPSDGFRPYRERLAEYYHGIGGRHIGADDIVVTVGGSEALLFAIGAVCDPGDDVVVCEPYYTNYAGFAHLLGARVQPVTTHASDGFRIRPEAVRQAIGERTRALVLPTPGNPTGVVLSALEIAELAELCRERDIFFVCDEVYREFVYDLPPGSRAPSLLAVDGMDEHAIVIDSVSKRYSACGARVGALITKNRELRAAVLRFGQARLSPPTVDQHAAMAALDTPAAYFHQVVGEYQKRRDVLVAGLRGIGIDCINPAGAFYLVATLPVADSDVFCRYLLESFELDGETVMLAPASGFYATPGLGKDQVRIAYVLGSDKLERCVHILRAALEAQR